MVKLIDTFSKYNDPRFYLVSKISPEYHKHNEAIADLVGNNAFIPHLHNPYNITHEKLEHSVFQTDLDAMNQSDFGIVSLPIGEDCSAECGWYAGNNKPIYVVIFDSFEGLSALEQYESLKTHWMVKGFITGVVVIQDKDVYELIMKDPILKDKVEHYEI